MKYYKILIFFILVTLLLTINIYHKVVDRKISEPLNSYLAQRYMPEKFWLHRTNSIEKQRELGYKYKNRGIEFDVIFHDKQMIFENSHDEENITKYNLEKQFKLYRELGYNEGIWLDFKNLDEENKYKAKKVLDELLKKYNIDKSKLWIESSNWKSLDVFKIGGYKTSYYFPYYDLKNLDEDKISKIQEQIKLIAESGNINAISFYGKYYDFISSLDIPEDIVFLS